MVCSCGTIIWKTFKNLLLLWEPLWCKLSYDYANVRFVSYISGFGVKNGYSSTKAKKWTKFFVDSTGDKKCFRAISSLSHHDFRVDFSLNQYSTPLSSAFYLFEPMYTTFWTIIMVSIIEKYMKRQSNPWRHRLL